MANNATIARAATNCNTVSATELIEPADPRFGTVSIDPERHSGTPCFAGSRVPIRDLFDYLEGGETLDSFLDSFPTVTREQAIRTLELALDALVTGHFS